jgi:hypothetical protein
MWYISESGIHGTGVFTNSLINPGQIIDIAIDNNNKVTYFGSKVNHSWRPNTSLYKLNNIYYLVADKRIGPFEEITANYMNTPDFIKKPDFNWK